MSPQKASDIRRRHVIMIGQVMRVMDCPAPGQSRFVRVRFRIVSGNTFDTPRLHRER
jgi:hypothetical protein